MKSIRFKLWSGMMALAIMVLVLLWLFQIVFLESFYTNMRISEVENEGIETSKTFSSSSKEVIESNLEELAFKNNVDIEIIDVSGNTIYESDLNSMGKTPMMMKNKERAEAFNSVLQNGKAILPYTHPRFGYSFVMIGVPIKLSEKLTGVMLMNMSLAPVKDTVYILKRQMIYIIGILFVASTIMSLIISRNFTRPILEIKKASEKMASGDFSVKVQVKSKDELGNLATTVNYLGQQLGKIDELRKDLIANVSHELRTPLSLIRGYSETIRDITGDSKEKRDKQIGIIISETERLSKIVDDILNLSQLQTGNMNLERAVFSLNDLINRVIIRFDILSENTRIYIVKNCDMLLVEADELRVEQVLYNLINNAFKYSHSESEIKINAFSVEDKVRVEIIDTGSGIPKEELEFIWDKYYKGNRDDIKNKVGTGLGLAIVKSILEAHGNAFGVESEEGKGSTFWFELIKAL